MSLVGGHWTDVAAEVSDVQEPDVTMLVGAVLYRWLRRRLSLDCRAQVGSSSSSVGAVAHGAGVTRGRRAGRERRRPGMKPGDQAENRRSAEESQRPAQKSQRPAANSLKDATCAASSDGRTVSRALATSAAVTSAASMDRRIAVRAASRSSATQSAAL